MRKKIEIALLRIAAAIIDRNVQRARYISRQDNNWLFEARYKIQSIADRMENDYKP